MSPTAMSGPSPSYRQVMVFVDGGYLREYIKKKWGNQELATGPFQTLLRKLIEKVQSGNIYGELIRTYYYDAIVDEKEKDERERQNKFFDTLRTLPFCTVRLGRLKTARKKPRRQKGVDILMAIDMLTKAYENHYDIAILVAGDGDFVDLVEAVKDAGKRVLGAYIKDHVDDKLLVSLDNHIIISDESLQKLAGK
jgi:uncharacterized LabA/DUF88 family protein